MQSALWQKLAVCLALLTVLASSCTLIESGRIEGKVKAALAKDERTQAYSFEIDYQGKGRVLITGTVWSAAELEAVAEVAAGVEGVEEVVNRCNIEEQGSGMLQDEVVVTPYL